jgi:hypothetical protein
MKGAYGISSFSKPHATNRPWPFPCTLAVDKCDETGPPRDARCGNWIVVDPRMTHARSRLALHALLETPVRVEHDLAAGTRIEHDPRPGSIRSARGPCSRWAQTASGRLRLLELPD